MDEFWNDLFRHTMSVYVDPEVNRRLDAGEIDKSWRLWGFQVILNVGEPVRVRFNNEVRGVFKGVLPNAGPNDVGRMISVADLETIDDVRLTLDDPNAAHITCLLHRENWWVGFDLRYNRARIRDYLEVSDQFLAAASDARSRSRLRPFVDSLLAAVEHLARCYLLLSPDEDLLKKNSSHNLVQTRFNNSSKFGEVDPEYTRLLNRLFELRNPARYMTKPFSLLPWEADELLESAKSLRREVEERLPPRFVTSG